MAPGATATATATPQTKPPGTAANATGTATPIKPTPVKTTPAPPKKTKAKAKTKRTPKYAATIYPPAPLPDDFARAVKRIENTELAHYPMVARRPEVQMAQPGNNPKHNFTWGNPQVRCPSLLPPVNLKCCWRKTTNSMCM